MERIKSLKNQLLSCVESAMRDLNNTDTKELKEAIEAIHYLDESIYYCTIVEAMESKDKEKGMEYHHYSEPSSGSSSGTRYYTERPMEWAPRDRREGRSPVQRRTYMETKEMHQGKEVQIKELEKYMMELTSDVMEMIEDASPEERQMLKTKISNLASKI